MRREILSLVAGIAVLGAVGGAYVAISPIGGQEEVLPDAVKGTLQACVPSDLPSPALTPVKGVPFPDPEAGLTDAERDALHRRLWDQFVTRYTAWLQCVDISKLDLHALPRHELNTSWLPGQLNLSEAASKANLIIIGTVTEFSPTPFSGPNTALAIDETLKGSPAPTLKIAQDGGVRPTEDWTGVTISEGGNRAMLLPGDRGVLLLQEDGKGGYYIQGVSGWFQIVNGVVRANSYNEWGPSVEGKTEAEFVEMIKAAVNEGTALSP